MSRAAFKVSEALCQKVRYLSGVGVPQDDIAKIVECSPKTLRKHFRRELDRGAAEGIATVAGYLFAAAKAGNVTAQIFIMKSRAGWKERVAPEVSAPDSKPVQQVIQIVYDEHERNL
jgi:hypothetical protein